MIGIEFRQSGGDALNRTFEKMQGSVLGLGKKADALDQSNKRLKSSTDSLGAATKRTESHMVQLKAAYLAGAAAIYAIHRATSHAIDSFKSWEDRKAGIQTITQDLQTTATVMSALDKVAADSVYGINDVTDSWVRMTNLGITASAEALEAFGNIAAGTRGKTMIDFTEAVADAITGEWERLKEFGIKARVEGDNVNFAFRGMTTTVKNNADEINKYLISIGENDFANAQAEKMDNLSVRTDKLKDSWASLEAAVIDGTVGDSIGRAMRHAESTVVSFTQRLASGQIETLMAGIANQFTAATNHISDGWNKTGVDTENVMDSVSIASGKAANDFVANFGAIPAVVIGTIESATVHVLSFTDKVLAHTKGLGVAISAALHGDTKGALSAIGGAFQETEKINKRAADQIEQTNVRIGVAIAHSQQNYFKANKQLEKFQLEQSKINKDVLGVESSKVKGLTGRSTGDIVSASKKREADRLAKKLAREAKQARDKAAREAAKLQREAEQQRKRDIERSNGIGLLGETETDRYKREYSENLAFLTSTNALEAEKKAELLGINKRFLDQRLSDIEDAERKKLDNVLSVELSERDQIIENELTKRQLILDNTAITETARADMMARLRGQTVEKLNELDYESMQQSSSNIQETLGTLGKLADEGSNTYRTMFALQKAFSIASTTLSINKAIGDMYSQGLSFDDKLMKGTAIAAQGAGLLATIASTDFAGGFATGGDIDPNKYAIVGENGMELIKTGKSGASVSSNTQTNKLLNELNGSGGGEMSVTIQNILDSTLIDSHISSKAGQASIINVIKNNPTTIKQILKV